MLHPWRRRRALARLRAGGTPRGVLFVCQGNIYRSPFAEQLFRARRPAALRAVAVASAGFVGPDRPCPVEAVAAAERCGIELRAHRSRLVDREAAARCSLVVVMDPEHAVRLRGAEDFAGHELLVLGDLDPLPIRARRIDDPWGREAAVLEASYTRIERCVRSLVDALARQAVAQTVARATEGVPMSTFA